MERIPFLLHSSSTFCIDNLGSLILCFEEVVKQWFKEGSMKVCKRPFIGASALCLSITLFGIIGCSDSDNSTSASLGDSSSSISINSSSSEAGNGNSSSEEATGSSSSQGILESSSSEGTVESSSSTVITSGDSFSCTTETDGAKVCIDYVGFTYEASTVASFTTSCESDSGVATSSACESGAALSCVIDDTDGVVMTMHMYNSIYSSFTCADMGL